ncbi:hypothetical protein D3C87_1897420 [compost metagenome]
MPQCGCDNGVRIVRLGIDDIADGQDLLFLGGIGHAETFGIQEVCTAIDLGECGLLRLGRIEP